MKTNRRQFLARFAGLLAAFGLKLPQATAKPSAAKLPRCSCDACLYADCLVNWRLFKGSGSVLLELSSTERAAVMQYAQARVSETWAGVVVFGPVCNRWLA